MKRFILILLFICFFVCLIGYANQKEDYQTLLDNACDSIYDDKYNDALKNINKAVKINPDLPDAYFARAGLYMIKGRYKDAVKDYDRVISLAPDNSNDAEFFGELARNAVMRPNAVIFHKYNVVFRMGEGKVIPENDEQQDFVNKIVYAKTVIMGHSEALKNYCSSTGVIPQKYLNLNSEAFKKTIENIDNIINKSDKETAILIEMNYKYRVENYDKIHDNDYEDLRKYMLEKNRNFTKADYCKSFDDDAEFFINDKIKKIKKRTPDLYAD